MRTARRRRALISFGANGRRLTLIYMETPEAWGGSPGSQGTSWKKPGGSLPHPAGSFWALRRKVPPASVPEAGFHSRLALVSKYLDSATQVPLAKGVQGRDGPSKNGIIFRNGVGVFPHTSQIT